MRDQSESVLWAQTVSDFSGSPADVEASPQRITVPVAYASSRIVLVLTNEYGSAPLRLAHVSVSFNGAEQNVLFGGEERCVIEPGDRLVSDAIDFPVDPSGRLAIAIEPDAGQLASTRGSAFDRTLVDGGVSDPAGARPNQMFYYGLSSVLAYGSAPTSAICFFGDSLINQGYVSGEASRLFMGEELGTVTYNCGISGNRLLRAGSGGSLWARSFGMPAVERFTRDVTCEGRIQPDAVFSLVGVNDLFQAQEEVEPNELPSAHELIEGFKKLDALAEALGTVLVMGTLPPFKGSVNRGVPAWNPGKELIRMQVNTWLRNRPNTVDVDRIVRCPMDGERLSERFDSGDHLHFSPDGGKLVGSEVYRTIQSVLDK